MFHLPWEDQDGALSPKADWRDASDEWLRFQTEIIKRLGEAGPSGRATPDATDYYGRADFRRVAFPSIFDFSVFESPLHATFEDASFGQIHGFSNASFGGLTSFRRATFREGVIFANARFGEEDVYVSFTIFKGAAMFEGASFMNEVHFSDATFSGSANFDDAKFGDQASFNGAKFLGEATFSVRDVDKANTKFQRINFSKAEFHGPCSFENRNFTANASFNDAEFHDLVKFHGCTFHQGMSFHDTKFYKTHGGYDAEGFENDAETEKLERSYRTLKLGMETLRARNEEAMFFAKEMECRRNRSDIGLFEHFVAFSYEKLSNYGQSILKPLVWLTGFTALMWCVYYVTGEKTLTDLVLDVISGKVESWEIAKFTIGQMFRPFFVWSATSGDKAIDLVRYNPFLIPLLASLQSLATLSLLALFLLALRRRFKMD